MVCRLVPPPKCGPSATCACFNLHRSTVGGVSVETVSAPRLQTNAKHLRRDCLPDVPNQISIECEPQACSDVTLAQLVSRFNKRSHDVR